MLTRRLYYSVKPFLPWRVRIALRRITAQRTRASCRETWPVDEHASTPPAGWPGWPEGKQFAFVMTHDVERTGGLEKCRQLMALDQELGIRSSFNFIPEGDYRVPAALREDLTAAGFEVGVHDLEHDGKLFHSRRSFERKAERINGYLRDWQATGFRPGFMLRNLDWLHDLDISYDSSTFDTDPFELQADGMRTIFPFWVESPGQARAATTGRAIARTRGGYWELPYTLPQDSTLFLVLRESSPDIWLRKLDWVASHGGMAMVNVHPDYMGFDARCRHDEYPVQHYRDLIRHLQTRYAGRYWNATPRQVTAWCRQSHPPSSSSSMTVSESPRQPTQTVSPPPQLRGRKAAVLLYSQYPSDPRPRRAATAMVEAGMSVDLLCLGSSRADVPQTENVNGVQVTRVNLQHRRDSKLSYLWQYGRFLLACFWFLTRNGLRKRYDIVHVHNMPDFLVFAALVPKLRGARLVLDLHDPMPELMMSIYGLAAQDGKVRLLRWLERRSIAFAHLVLTPNKSFKDLFVSRSCAEAKLQIVMNSPEEKIFDPDRFPADAAVDTGAFRVMHHGSILHRHGVDLLVAAIAQARPEIPGLRLDIYGFREPFLDVVLETARQLKVDDIVHYHGPKNQAEIALAIRECDVGVVPNRQTPFTEINFPTRLFEYLSMHRPVIAPATRGIQDYFGPDQLLTFRAEQVDDLARQLIWVHRHRSEADEIVRRGVAVYRHHLWRNEKSHFLNLLSRLEPVERRS